MPLAHFSRIGGYGNRTPDILLGGMLSHEFLHYYAQISQTHLHLWHFSTISVNDTKETRSSAKNMLSAKTPDVEQRGTSDGSCKSAYIGWLLLIFQLQYM